MSLNTVLGCIEGQSPTQVRARLPGYRVAVGQTSFEEATSSWSEGVALAEIGGWTVLCHSAERRIPEMLLEVASVSGRALTLLFGGAGDVYGFRLAAQGQLVRELIYAQGEAVQESGGAPPEEVKLEASAHEEEWLFGLMEAVTGITLEDLLDIPFQRWAEQA